MFNYNMDNIRVISLNKKTNKRQLYKEILSSSSKVKDIISKRKTRNKKLKTHQSCTVHYCSTNSKSRSPQNVQKTRKTFQTNHLKNINCMTEKKLI